MKHSTFELIFIVVFATLLPLNLFFGYMSFRNGNNFIPILNVGAAIWCGHSILSGIKVRKRLLK